MSIEENCVYGYIAVIKRNGDDKTKFPMATTTCLCGRDKNSDIRIYNKAVSWKHCELSADPDRRVSLIPLQTLNPTLLNGSPVTERVTLRHNDVFTIVDRHFRFEYPKHSLLYKPHADFFSDSIQIMGLQMKSPVCSKWRNNSSMANHDEITSSRENVCVTADHDVSFDFTDGCDNFKHLDNHLFSTKRFFSKRSSVSSLQTASEYQAARKVRFGPALSPEQFDKTLPPASPLKRGSMPNKFAFKEFLSKSMNSSHHSITDNQPDSTLTGESSIVSEKALPFEDRSNTIIEQKKHMSIDDSTSAQKTPEIPTNVQNISMHKPIRQPSKNLEFGRKTASKDIECVEPKLSLPTAAVSEHKNIISRLSELNNSSKDKSNLPSPGQLSEVLSVVEDGQSHCPNQSDDTLLSSAVMSTSKQFNDKSEILISNVCPEAISQSHQLENILDNFPVIVFSQGSYLVLL